MQDFGYADGKVGGQIWRTSTPAYYALPIDPPGTLNDKLEAAGTFTIDKSAGTSGAILVWFNSNQPGGVRPPGSITF